MLEGIAGQLGVVLQTRLFKNSRTVRADCRDTQIDIFCNLAHGLPGSDETEHLIFPIGQPFMRKLLDPAPNRQGQGLSHGCADILSAGQSFFTACTNSSGALDFVRYPAAPALNILMAY